MARKWDLASAVGCMALAMVACFGIDPAMAQNFHGRTVTLTVGYGTGSGNDTTLAGLVATFRYKPLRTALYRGLILRAEAVRSSREQPEADASAWGWFASGEYRLARRWWAGARYERAERAADPDALDSGEAALVTFDPSEFSRIRGEYRRRHYAEGVDADELLVQLQFIIGAHGAHPF